MQATVQEMDQVKQLAHKPFLHIAFTFLEPFPVGLIITVISAAILRKKKAVISQ
jgi:hypothetical protein